MKKVWCYISAFRHSAGVWRSSWLFWLLRLINTLTYLLTFIRTDGRTFCKRRHSPRLCKASRGKNETILMPIGTSNPRSKDIKRSTLGSWGQRSRSHEAEDRLGGVSEASQSSWEILGEIRQTSGSGLIRQSGLESKITSVETLALAELCAIWTQSCYMCIAAV